MSLFLVSLCTITYRFGKVLSGLQPTFELQCGGITNLTSVKTTRKLVSVALEVKIKEHCFCIIFFFEKETLFLLIQFMSLNF
jgi:hypothetical protein